MASLYLAHRPPATDIVAVKVIRDQFREVSRIVRMFQDEVRTLTYIDHPNVVRVLEAGEYSQGRYLAMEYVHGCSLARLIDELDHLELPLPVPIAVHIGIEVARALHASHEAVDDEDRPLNIVHRDVSPQNVMISDAGAVKLIDFGVAKASGRLEVTNAKLIKGKLRYMSPEQAGGKALDRRTDLFALGVVIWEMLTRKRFSMSDGDVDLFTRLLDPRATPPSDYRPEVSPELDAVVLETLSKSPSARPATGLELAELLSASTDVSESRQALRALVNELFGVELEYTRQWIAESFTLPDESAFASYPIFDDDSHTDKMSRDVLGALAAQKVTRDELVLVESASWSLDEGPHADVTRNLRRPKRRGAAKKEPRLDLTFTVLTGKGPESTGARPLVSPYEGPGVVSDPKLGGGFDELDDTDALAVRCLANLRHATWARRPAGSPPSLSVIAPLTELEAAPTVMAQPPKERLGARFWLLLGVVALLVLGAGFATTWLLLVR